MSKKAKANELIDVQDLSAVLKKAISQAFKDGSAEAFTGKSFLADLTSQMKEYTKEQNAQRFNDAVRQKALAKNMSTQEAELVVLAQIAKNKNNQIIQQLNLNKLTAYQGFLQAKLAGDLTKMAEMRKAFGQAGTEIKTLQQENDLIDQQVAKRREQIKHKLKEDELDEKKEKVREKIEEVSKALKTQLGYTEEIRALLETPQMARAVFAEQMAEKVSHLNHMMHELVDSGMQAGEAIHIMSQNFSIMNMAGLSKVGEVSNELVSQFGTINALTKEQRHNIGEMAAKMGLTGEEATNLTMAISRMPGESKDTATNFKETAMQVGKTAGIIPSQLMKDMAKNSGLMATYSKGGAEGFAKAAAASKKMGVELSTVLSAAEKTLDFESSINSQMEASLMIGKNLNFDRMRAAALSGDANAIMEEQTAIMQQVGSLDDMNVLQKKALADAMGMTVEEMVKMNEAQEMQNQYFGENASAMDNVIGGVMKYGGAAIGFVTDNGLMILSMIQTVAQLGTMMALRAKDTASIATNTAATRLSSLQMTVYRNQRLAGATAEEALSVARSKSTLGIIKDSVATAFNTVVSKVSQAAQYAWNAAKGIGITIMNSSVGVWVRETAATIANTTAKYASAAADGTWNAVKGIGNFLMNTSIGMYIAEKVQLGLSTIAKWANVGATAAQAGANGTLAATQTALATTGAAAGGGMAAAGAGLGAFGAAALPAIPVILALGAGILMVGAGIGIAAYGISLMADSFAKMPFDNLVMLPVALMGIGAGLGMMAIAGSQAIPVIGMLITLAAVAPRLTGLATALTGGGGGGEKGGESKELEVLKEIKTAITDTLNAPIIVKIDGNAVATASRQATSTSGIDATIDK